MKMLLVLAVFLCLNAVTLPLRSATPPQAASSCCARVLMRGQQNDCAKHMPKSQPDRQCCAACAAGLTLFPGAAVSFCPSSFGKQAFESSEAKALARSLRPPTPPPRV